MKHIPGTRVKICGITRPADALDAACAGADAIGLVFYPRSPRAVSITDASRILAVLPPFVTTVGLFVNPSETEVHDVLASVQLDVLQFHGDEEPQFCASFNRSYLKALRVRPGMDLAAALQRYSSAQGILLDAWHETLTGGTGLAFDWDIVDRLDKSVRMNHRLILAGGLQPGNVVQAIHKTRPWAVDVSSGVESAPGIKTPELIQQFINAAQSA